MAPRSIPEETEFSDYEVLRQYLNNEPRQVALTIASRSALRVLPLIIRSEEFGNLHVLACFRAAAIAWAAAAYPSRGKGFRPAASKAREAASRTSKRRDLSGGSRYVLHASEDAAAAVVANAVHNTINALISGTDALALAGISDRGLVQGGNIEPELRYLNDLELIQEGRDRRTKAALATQVARSELWRSGMPDWFSTAWDSLKGPLLTSDDRWDVWIRWYDERIAGVSTLGEVFEVSVATLADELWEQGPLTVNTRIKELIVEHTPTEPIPVQGAGPHFALNPDLKIALAPPTEIDADGNNISRIRQLLPQVRQAVGDLAGHVSQNSQPEISRNLAQYREAIGGEPETIAWGTVFGLGVRLENAATAARRDIANRLQEPLEDAAHEALDSVLTLHGPLILATAEGRDLSDQADQFRLTREEQAALRDAARQVAGALKNSDLADASAASFTEEAVETIGEGRHPERGSIFGLATVGNIATILIPTASLAAVGLLAGTYLNAAFGGVLGAGLGAVGSLTLKESERAKTAAKALGLGYDHIVDTVLNTAKVQNQLLRIEAVSALRRLTPFRDFVTRNEKSLREIAQNSTQMRWALRYIDFITRTNPPKE